MIGDPNAPFTNTLPDITENTDVLDSEMNSRYKILLDNDSRLNALLAQHTTQISALQGQVLTLQQNLSTAQGQIATLQSQVAELMDADTTPPTVTLAASDTTIDAAGSMTLTATASDDTGISKVEFYRNGVKIGEDASSPYTLVENYILANNGTHTYFARAIDSSSNHTDSNIVTVTVNIPAAEDTTDPVITLIADKVDPMGILGNQPLTLYANAADAGSGIERVEFYRNGVLVGTTTDFPYTFTFEYDMEEASGTDVWTAKAYDNAGNSTTSAAQNVSYLTYVAAESPVLTMPTINGGLVESVSDFTPIEISVTATDDVAVTWVDFFYRKGPDGVWQTMGGTDAGDGPGGNTYTFSKNLFAGDSGIYEFFVLARDGAFNHGASPVSSILVLIPDDAGRAIYQGTKTNAMAAAPGGWYKPVSLLAGSVQVPAGKKLYLTGNRSISYTPDGANLGPAEIEIAYMKYDPAGDLVYNRVTVLNHNTSADETTTATGSGDILIYHNTSGSDAQSNLYINIKNPQAAGGSSVKGEVVYDLKFKLTS